MLRGGCDGILFYCLWKKNTDLKSRNGKLVDVLGYWMATCGKREDKDTELLSD